MKKVGPVDPAGRGSVQHGTCHSHGGRIALECLENLLAPVRANDAVVFGQRDDLAARLSDRACAQVKHRCAGVRTHVSRSDAALVASNAAP